jgi:recombination protein RecR
MFSPLIEQLIKDMRCLPGVGPTSAQRMVFHILERDRQAGMALSKSIANALDRVGHCEKCRTLSEMPRCQICSDIKRDEHLLCVVETPTDIVAIENTHVYKGYYFVLMGHLSPLEGIGPEELGIKEFLHYINLYHPTEVILATGSTVEGETTAHYLSELLKPYSITVTRIAHGIPLGNELDFVDSSTLTRALSSRKKLISSEIEKN